MLVVAEAGGTTVSCPRGGRYAFFNSPYPAHRLMTGVDIYPGAGFGEPCPSPISGTVTEVRRVKAPKGRLFEDKGYDSVIVIRSSENPGHTVKVLHVDPAVAPGDAVRVGGCLGTLIRSGYFSFHTPAHAHVEVRPLCDPLRVRGGCVLRSSINTKGIEPAKELNGTVIYSSRELARIRLSGVEGAGLPAEVSGRACVLDGRVPIYGWAGVHLREAPGSGTVRLLGVPIAHVTKSYGWACVGECLGFRVRISGVEAGLFLSLHAGGPVSVAVSPREPGGLNLSEGDEVEITVEPLGNA